MTVTLRRDSRGEGGGGGRERGGRKRGDGSLKTGDCRAEIGEFGDTNPIPRLDVALNQVVQLLSLPPEPLPLTLSVCLSTPLIFITRSIDSSPCPCPCPPLHPLARGDLTQLCAQNHLLFSPIQLSPSLSLSHLPCFLTLNLAPCCCCCCCISLVVCHF